MPAKHSHNHLSRWYDLLKASVQAAVDMMREVLGNVEMDGVVVIGEGEKDEAPMLYCGTYLPFFKLGWEGHWQAL